MDKLQLVIMAAGLGSRFGGLKQVSPVDEEGHLIIDFSIYDALRAGFTEVIFVVKPEHEQIFRQSIADRVGQHVPVRFAHQTLDALPGGFSVPEGRAKPWGTGHAVMCAAKFIDSPFAVINADDFYGREAFGVMADFLKAPHAAHEHALVGYRIENTLTENGTVSRGVCSVKDDCLTGIVERTSLEPAYGGARFYDEGTEVLVPAGTPVSMNLWGFGAQIIEEFVSRFALFLREQLPVNPLKCEYYLPLVPSQLIAEHKASFRVLKTHARWYGVTYQADMPGVRSAIKAFKEAGEYPAQLWR